MRCGREHVGCTARRCRSGEGAARHRGLTAAVDRPLRVPRTVADCHGERATALTLESAPTTSPPGTHGPWCGQGFGYAGISWLWRDLIRGPRRREPDDTRRLRTQR